MQQKLCRCGLIFTPGRPGFGECPRCHADAAARLIEDANEAIFDDTTGVINALAAIMQCVAEWPHLLIMGDGPGYCADCSEYVSRRWDSFCGRCLDIRAREDEEAALRRGAQPWPQEGPKNYGEKHGN